MAWTPADDLDETAEDVLMLHSGDDLHFATELHRMKTGYLGALFLLFKPACPVARQKVA